MNAGTQQTLDLGREFREPVDRTVPLVVDGLCYGRFVSAELRDQTARAIERSAISGLHVPHPRCL